MERIMVYEVESKIFDKICTDNNISEAELFEMLMEHIVEVKEENNLI